MAETTTRKCTDMDNTMQITIPWKPGMAVMLKDGFLVNPSTLPYTTTPKPESIQKEPFKLWKGLGPNTNRKEH